MEEDGEGKGDALSETCCESEEKGFVFVGEEVEVTVYGDADDGNVGEDEEDSYHELKEKYTTAPIKSITLDTMAQAYTHDGKYPFW